MEMLDEEHEPLPQQRGDTDIYNLSSINNHNVIIAGFPRAGNCLVATVIAQMKMTFPSLNYCLSVGIGSGVPMKTNHGMIRLGHVVVSEPAGIHSGVVQYDHGKVKAGEFHRKGSLAPPLTGLLNAARSRLFGNAAEPIDLDPAQSGLKLRSKGEDTRPDSPKLQLARGVDCAGWPQSKSQLAIEFAYRARERSSGTSVFWIHVSNISRFEQGFRDIATSIKLPGRQDPKANIFQLLNEWLQDEAEGPWVLILDDVDDASYLKSLSPGIDTEATALGTANPRQLVSYITQ
ncbi:hypothetical protein QQS21_012535 [Conoideocrella luteorostrata]|uniref:Nucleoside phosphorylase domain-containing protein n=1 Tax=Conoideocrella luteorostrata TaxID=1105319 RepID=A0AAJ0FSD2_9HYPO|nr:hypothetical protein QQS21_012535 [Conoideocrella luteorostrata]